MGQVKPGADNGAKHALALLQVNRQIYADASLFPFLHNTFEGWHNGHLFVWIESLSQSQRDAITSVKHHQRSYILQSRTCLEVSPIFWMDTPRFDEWKLRGLKQIKIEVVLNTWGLDLDQLDTNAAKAAAMEELQKLVEKRHPGVRVLLFLKQ